MYIMPRGVLALTVDGNITYCTAPEDMRGKGRCPHVAHQMVNESDAQFLGRIADKMQNAHQEVVDAKGPVNQQDVDNLAAKLDEIAGVRLTPDNLMEVLTSLEPQQVADIAKIGFDAAPLFSLPISDEDYEDENIKNKLYFATLPKWGVAGNMAAIQQMFIKVGQTPVGDGDVTIEHSYKEGLTPDEYFSRQFMARDAMINKSVGTAKPGYVARKLFYALSDLQVVKDCGGEHVDALHCSMPEGHVCEMCAHATHGGEAVHKGDLVGGWVSTNLSEALTQLSMKQKHVGAESVRVQGDHSRIIMATLDGWSTSPIINRMKAAKTTEERRSILYEGLKKEYSDAGIEQDDFNLQMVARKLTSYKRDVAGIRPIKNDNELCDIVSIGVAGNANNIFKAAELGSGYRYLTKPTKQTLKRDAANEILR
jgi:hypothetical protein